MRKNTLIIAFYSLMLISSCDSQAQAVEKKQKLLKQYQTEASTLKEKIQQLEQALIKEDPTFAKSHGKATLVTTRNVEIKKFKKFLEVSGELHARKNIVLSAEVLNTIIEVPVRPAQFVHKNQLLVLFDTTAQGSKLAKLRSDLALAQTLYERQAHLWKKNIGTEIQYLEAESKKNSLENQLANAYAEFNKITIKAPFSGILDEIFIKAGESVQPGTRLVRLVNLDDLYVKADFSEKYIGKINKGDSAVVVFPALHKTLHSKITAVGQVIHQDNRTFTVECKVPMRNKHLKPNILAAIRVKTFEQDNAVVVPTDLIQQDSKGNYVFTVAVDTTSHLAIAQKVYIKRGHDYGNETMVLSGLVSGEQLIDQGFRQVHDKALVKVLDAP